MRVDITEIDSLAQVYDKFGSAVFNQKAHKTHYVYILLLDQNMATVYIMTDMQGAKPVQSSQEPIRQAAAVEGAILQPG